MTAELVEAESESVTVRRVRATRRGRVETALGLPPRPKTATFAGETDWTERATCGQTEVPEADRDAFLTVDRQADAWLLAARYCSQCPVRELCLEDGRNVHGSGLYGGVVLADGNLAPDRHGEEGFRDVDAWTPPRWSSRVNASGLGNCPAPD